MKNINTVDVVFDIHTVVVCDVDGVLTDGTVYVDQSGHETLRFNKRDAWLIGAAREAGILVALVTDDTNTQIVEARAAKMGVEYHGPAMSKVDVVQFYRFRMKRVVYVDDKKAHEVPAIRLTPADGCLECERLRTPGGGGVLHEVLDRLMRGEWK